MTVMPYAIDANGKPVSAPVINALYHPNQQDSSVSFFEKLSVSTLVHPKTYLLVWRREGNDALPGGDITPQNIAGFTFLEYPAITRMDGRTYYRMGQNTYNDKEVIVLPGGVDPYSLYSGYSPAEASRRWAKLDDYIADYQAGFFENGAIPAGQFVITAATSQEFNDIVDRMEQRNRGAGKNGNVSYVHAPLDPASGKPADAQVKWIPFAQSNKDIDFKNLFEQANRRVDSAFGVPASIRGVGENNNYATAQTDQQNFIRFTVKPLATRIYTTLTHELNRITNGLGVAVTFKIELPAIADEQKTIAETKAIEVQALTALVTAGFSLDTVVDALDISTSYKLLKEGSGSPVIENDKPDVDEGGEVNESPDPNLLDGIFKQKATNHVHGGSTRTNPKADETSDYEARITAVAAKFLQKQVDKAVADQKAEGELTNEVSGDYDSDDLEDFVAATLAIETEILTENGEIQHPKGIELFKDAGLSTESITDFKLTSAQTEAYRIYLDKVGKSYGKDTKDSIDKVLTEASRKGLSSQEIQTELRKIPELDNYRAVRMGRSETVRAEASGSLFSMEQIQDDTGYSINKVWNIGGSNPCEYCLAQAGVVVSLGSAFVPLGGVIQGQDGGVLVNDFVEMDTADAHPNDECYITYEVAG